MSIDNGLMVSLGEVDIDPNLETEEAMAGGRLPQGAEDGKLVPGYRVVNQTDLAVVGVDPAL